MTDTANASEQPRQIRFTFAHDSPGALDMHGVLERAMFGNHAVPLPSAQSSDLWQPVTCRSTHTQTQGGGVHTVVTWTLERHERSTAGI